MARRAKVEHHVLSWKLVKTHTKKGKLIQFWSCAEHPGLVLTWICKEKVSETTKEWPFNGFDSIMLKDLIAEHDKVAAHLKSKIGKRVRLKKSK